MQKISILDFFKTGNFGDIKLGFCKSKVISFMGKNTEIYNCINGEILKYTDVEFHFSNDELVMILCDSLDFLYEDLNLGAGIKFDYWIFQKDKIYSFWHIKEELLNIIFLIDKVSQHKIHSKNIVELKTKNIGKKLII